MTEQEILDGIEPVLQSGKCILVLGPEAHLLDKYSEQQLPSHWDIIVSQVDELKGRSLNAAEGFFFRSGSTDEWFLEKTQIHRAISKYYSQLKPPTFYEYLASLPFNMVISLSPDDLMAQVMERFGYTYDFVYYKKTNGGSQHKLYIQKDKKNGKRVFENAKELDHLPDAAHPLIFNFLGYFDDSDSMLYTYESLFEFMYDVFPVKNIPDDIKSAISGADAYLFIGFGYKYWYLKIIFFLFDKILKDQSRELRSQAIFNFGDEQNPIIKVYQQVFKMQFFKMPTTAFASLLFSRCANSDSLRQKPAGSSRLKVLLIASLPNGKMPIRPDKDWAVIKEELQVPIALGKVELHEELCAKAEDILHHLNVYLPNLLIISVHGSKNGLFFETEQNDEAVELTGDALLQKLNAHKTTPGSQLQIVLLGACNSSGHAEKLSQAVDHVIGMNGPVHDESVRLFTSGFLRNFCIAGDTSSSVEAGKDRIADDLLYNADKDLVSYFQKAVRIATAGVLDASADRGTVIMGGKQIGKND